MPTTGESEEVNEEEIILELKREKRGRKTVVSKTRHNLERLKASGEDSESIEDGIETLGAVLDSCLAVMEELQGVFFLRLGDNENKKAVVEEADGLEKEVHNVIEKRKNLADQEVEPTNIKMARLRQSLTGTALEAIRGLGVSDPEYKEAKEILQSKFGGERRRLQAYMDQIEKMSPLKSNDVQSFERFADLVRMAVLKLKAEGRDGELEDGALHSLLVRKSADSQVVSYILWLREHKKDRSVLGLRDWLKEEVRIRVKAVEMAHGIKAETVGAAVDSGKQVDKVTIESLDGDFSKGIKVKTCPKRVTGNYKVENWKQSKDRWPHLRECDFAEPAQEGLVDLLIGVDNAELHYSRADVRGGEGDPVARLGPLRWTCIGSPEGKQWTGARAHISRTLFTRDLNVSVSDVYCDVDRTLKRFWKIENCGIERLDTVIFTEEEKKAMKRLKESVSYTGNGYKDRYMLLSDEINEQMKQYVVCNEDFDEIQQEMNRIEDRFDEIAPCAQSLEQQDNAEGDKDLHPDFAGNYNLSDELGIPSVNNSEPLIMNELPDDEYRHIVQTLNKEKKEFFYHVLHLIKTSEEPFYCFLSSGAGVGKSHVTKALYQAALKYYNTRPGININETKVLMLAPADLEPEGFMHTLSPIKKVHNKSKTPYFDYLVQTSNASKVRAVCYETKKRTTLHQAYSSKSPVKISGVKRVPSTSLSESLEEYKIVKMQNHPNHDRV
ncbi:hypothetical protein AWC38_SpisGene19627 [Stylophora pistillata]|uniref:Uncharacterized protein n=1 Tax=Stylophora pistillata TaxID=50429 RepID=A0A2B4RIN8_STYPI|nr:hypothetical protein AWC38_SpisGene19627 [Stylophora pistillata]